MTSLPTLPRFLQCFVHRFGRVWRFFVVHGALVVGAVVVAEDVEAVVVTAAEVLLEQAER